MMLAGRADSANCRCEAETPPATVMLETDGSGGLLKARACGAVAHASGHPRKRSKGLQAKIKAYLRSAVKGRASDPGRPVAGRRSPPEPGTAAEPRRLGALRSAHAGLGWTVRRHLVLKMPRVYPRMSVDHQHHHGVWGFRRPLYVGDCSQNRSLNGRTEAPRSPFFLCR
jgi:hypothetical protein